MSGRRNFVYQPRTIEDVQQRQQEVGSDSPGILLDQYKVYQARKGDNWIRILPATWDGARHWAFDVWVHYQVGPDRATVICNNRMGQGHCYGCELRMAADKAGDEEESKLLRPRRRAVCWLIDRKAEEEGPQLWAMPSTLDEDIQGISIDRTTGQLYLCDDPNQGYDVTFDKTGERINTRYNSPSMARSPSSVHPSYIDYIVDNPVPACLIWRSYEEVRAMYEGGMGNGQNDQAPAQVQQPQRFGRGPAPQAAPARTMPGTRGPAPGYPPSGPAQQAGPAMPQRRAFGGPARAPTPAAPPVDNYRGEQYAVDPNYPPPQNGWSAPGPSAEYYGNGDPRAQSPETWEEPPPWEGEQYQQDQYAPPAQQYQPPQQYQAPPPNQMPPRRAAPQQQPPQQYMPPTPPQAQAWPGRNAAPPAQVRGGTSPAETAARLQQQFGRR